MYAKETKEVPLHLQDNQSTKWEIAPDKVSKHETLVEKILSSNVDVTVKGWPIKMAAELGVSRNHVKRFIKKHLPSLWENCFIEVGKRRF